MNRLRDWNLRDQAADPFNQLTFANPLNVSQSDSYKERALRRDIWQQPAGEPLGQPQGLNRHDTASSQAGASPSPHGLTAVPGGGSNLERTEDERTSAEGSERPASDDVFDGSLSGREPYGSEIY